MRRPLVLALLSVGAAVALGSGRPAKGEDGFGVAGLANVHSAARAALRRSPVRRDVGLAPLDPDASIARLVARRPDLVPIVSGWRPLQVGRELTAHTLFEAYVRRWSIEEPDASIWLGIHPHPIPKPLSFDAVRLRRLLLARDLWKAARGLQRAELDAHATTDAALAVALAEDALRQDDSRQEDDALYWAIDTLRAVTGLGYSPCCQSEEDWHDALDRHLARYEERVRAAFASVRTCSREALTYARRELAMLREQIAPLEKWEHPRAAATVATLRSGLAIATSRLGEIRPDPARSPRLGRAGVEVRLRVRHEVTDSPEVLLEHALDELAAETSRLAAAEPNVGRAPIRQGETRDDLSVDRLARGVEKWVLSPPLSDPGVSVTQVPEILRAHYAPPRPLATFWRSQIELPVLPQPETEEQRIARRDYLRHALAHEAYPGHHLDEALGRESGCPVRGVYGDNLHREGWARHAEELAEVAFPCSATSTHAWLLAAGRAGIAALAICDLALHAEVATPAGVRSWVRDAFGYERLSLYEDLAAHPLREASYFIGLRELRALEQRERERLGERWHERTLHDRFLRAGPIPPRAFERELRRRP